MNKKQLLNRISYMKLINKAVIAVIIVVIVAILLVLNENLHILNLKLKIF